MPTLYTRTFDYRDSLSDVEAAEELRWLVEDCAPLIEGVSGVRAVKFYSGAGALRADIIILVEMDDAAAYERIVVDPELSPMIARLYGAWNMKSATQSFRREITPELLRALSGTG